MSEQQTFEKVLADANEAGLRERFKYECPKCGHPAKWSSMDLLVMKDRAEKDPLNQALDRVAELEGALGDLLRCICYPNNRGEAAFKVLMPAGSAVDRARRALEGKVQLPSECPEVGAGLDK